MAGTCCLSELNDTEPTTFDVDPVVYEDGLPARRLSAHQTMDGARRP